MFSDEEIEALVLGSRWVARRTDEPLARAAANAIAKIAEVLPDDLRERMDDSGLLAGPGSEPKEERIDLTPIRQAIRAERKLILRYVDAKGERSKRTVWPIVLGFFDRSRVLAAWCELRQDYRHFRTDHRPSSDRQALPAAPARLDEGMARDRRNSRANLASHHTDRN